MHHVGYLNRGRMLPAPPRVSFPFLVDEDLLRSNHYKTVARMIGWARDNMSHFVGGHETRNIEAHWQVRGDIPTSRVIEERIYDDPDSSYQFGPTHWTAGCHGTSQFFAAILRSANIPVQYFKIPDCGHGVPMFFTIQMTLTHGDDPYAGRSGWDSVPPPYPADLLLISTDTFDDLLLGPGGCDNVGRRVTEIAAATLPDGHLRDWCADEDANLSHAEGAFYLNHFERHFTVAELEAQDLWERAADEAEERDTCPP
jgi:hypothetical protein